MSISIQAAQQRELRDKLALSIGAAALLGVLLSFLDAFGFLGSLANLAAGLACAVVARIAVGWLPDSGRGLAHWAGRVLAPISILAAVYFGAGAVVLARQIDAQDIGRVEQAPLDFVAMIPTEQGAHSYEAVYEVALRGGADTARVAFGSLDPHVTDLDFTVLEPQGKRVTRLEPSPEHKAVLLFERSPSIFATNVRVRAELDPSIAEGSLPELIHAAVAIDYGKKDLWWRLDRHFRARY